MKITRDQASGQSAADLLQKLKNPKPLLSRIGQTLVDAAVGRVIGLKEDPQGTPWAPWAASTLKARQKKGNESRGLLYDSGEMVKSINYQIVGNTVEVGVTGPRAQIAMFHQLGTPKMPARPFLGIGPGEQDAILTHMKNSFRGKST